MRNLSKSQIAGLLAGPAIIIMVLVVGFFKTRPAKTNTVWSEELIDSVTQPRGELPQSTESTIPVDFPNDTLPQEEPSQEKSYDLSKEQKLRAEQLTSLFENGKIELQYAYVENLDDGRGYTAGRAGFTTADGDAYEVVKLYTQLKSNNSLAKYVAVLKELAHDGSDSVKDLKGYDKAWRDSVSVKEFRQAQDAVVDKLYYQPAKLYADRLGLKLAISRAFLYDTIIQHGDGGDGDSISALLKESNFTGNEVKWLYEFIELRRADLKNPENSDTQDEWKKSTGRCDVYKQILDANNYDLTGPIKIKTGEYKVTMP